MSYSLLFLGPIVACFLAGALAPLLWRTIPRATGLILAAAPLFGLIAFASMVPTVTAGNTPLWQMEWLPQLDLALAFRLDPWSLLLALVVTGVGVPLIIYGGSYAQGDARGGRMLAMLCAFAGAMLGLVLADHLLILYVCWELTSVLSFLLMGHKHEKLEARYAARRAFVLTVGGGLALMGAILLLVHASGTWYLSELLAGGSLTESPVYAGIVACVALAVATKSAQAPFHVWLPGAMTAPTPVSCYLHAATMVKGGIFLLGALLPILGGSDLWLWTFGIMGTVTAVWAGIRLLLETDAKGVVAWSTVSALGMMVALMGVATPAAAVAVALLLAAHALYKACLFMVVGSIDHGTGTRDLTKVTHLRKAMPITAVIVALAALSLAGLPPLGGFVAKEYILKAMKEMPIWMIIGLCAAASAGAAAAAVLAIRPFHGKDPTITDVHAHEVPKGMWMPAGFLALAGLALGIGMNAWAPFFVSGGERLVAAEVPKPKAWPGTGLILLAGLSLGAVGIALGWFLRKWRPGLLRLKWPDGAALIDGMFDGIIKLAKVHTKLVVNGSLRSYIGMLTIVAIGAMLVGLLLVAPSEFHFPQRADHPLDIPAMMLAFGGLGALLVLRDRIAATISLGVLGAGVALIFLTRGGPDLALTQLSVEALTVLLMILAFKQLPRLGKIRGGASGWWSAGIALAFGLCVALSLISFQPGPGIGESYHEISLTEAYGRNIVNVILVDFRALDTLGEISVLGLAAIGLYAVLRPRSV